eukprot:gene7216-8024_t
MTNIVLLLINVRRLTSRLLRSNGFLKAFENIPSFEILGDFGTAFAGFTALSRIKGTDWVSSAAGISFEIDPANEQRSVQVWSLYFKVLVFRLSLLSLRKPERLTEPSPFIKMQNSSMDIATFLRRRQEQLHPKSNKGYKKRIPLYHFIHFILQTPEYNHLASWIEFRPLHFRINSPEKIAIMWGQVKGKTNMTYAKFARAIRYYYGKDIIEKVENQDFVYRFIISTKTRNILQLHSHFLSKWHFDLPSGSERPVTGDRPRMSSDAEEYESETEESVGSQADASKVHYDEANNDLNNMDLVPFYNSLSCSDSNDDSEFDFWSGCDDVNCNIPLTYFPDEFLKLIDCI